MNDTRELTEAAIKRQRKRWLIWLAVILCIFAWLYPHPGRTFPGRVIRFFFLQKGVGYQFTDDLAEDVSDKTELAPLQDWATKTLERYRAGKVATNGEPEYWSHGTVKLAASEIPAWLSNAWAGDPPEVSIRLNKGNPECIVVAWYLKGLLVGPTNYTTSGYFYLTQAKPGIYAYANNK